MPTSRSLAASLLLLLGAVLLAACGSDGARSGNGDDSPAQPMAGTAQSDLEHIHGLGADPGSGTLYVATHTGLFQAPSGQAKLRRIGNSRQDIMGFSVLGPGRFLGSGHPDPGENLPPNLGLIESSDRGRSWKNISLLGQADFHVLRSAGRSVYGLDSGSGQLMASKDAGRRWATRTPPPAMIDLAIDPGNSDRILASTEQGLFASPNGGKGWKPLSNNVGLLAWPIADRLYLVDGGGQVARSTDGGKGFTSTGNVGGRPGALVSAGDDLYVALGDGTVKRSADGGASWSLRAGP